MSNIFGKGVEIILGKKWNWEDFKTTEGFPVSDSLLDWVVGQDRALMECELCLDEFIHKQKWLDKEEWWKDWEDKETSKPEAKKKTPPGPYLLLLGDPGTGKSLIGQALADRLTQLYSEHKISLRDILCWQNKKIPSEPKISVKEAGKGKLTVLKEKLKQARKTLLGNIATKLLIGSMIGIGMFIIGMVGYMMYLHKQTWDATPWRTLVDLGMKVKKIGFTYYNNIFQYLAFALLDKAMLLMPAFSMLFFVYFIRYLRGGGFGKGSNVGGAVRSPIPKLIVDNSSKRAPFIDATGHTGAQLFGSIAWDPYQTGGLGTPEHQRVSSGDVHKAHLGILYIDEIKNLRPHDAVTLLTVLEDGQLPITLRSEFRGSGSAAMNVSTEPVPCMDFFVAAGNFDSIGQIHPALMDRLYGYGKVVRMNNDMSNTIKNRRRVVQFIAQEVKRFRLLPFSRGACEELVDESRRRSGKRKALTTKFRPLISIIKTSSTLASNEKGFLVLKKHVKEAIDEHCKSIQLQILEHHQEEHAKYLLIEPEAKPILGNIYGLAVVSDPYSGEKTGSVLRVKASMIKKKQIKRDIKGYYKVTGIAKGDKERFIKDSVEKVRAVVLRRYREDIAQDYFTHIDFSQSYGVDGPSAGVTMAILLCSLIEGKPLRQDVAVTGEINVSSEDKVDVTAVGGLYQKIKAAEKAGFKKVLIPQRNFEVSVDPRDYNLEIVGCATLDDYLDHLLVSNYGKEKETK